MAFRPLCLLILSMALAFAAPARAGDSASNPKTTKN
jgi:hypothetical protein